MKLLTKQIEARLPSLGATSRKSASETEVIVKYFDPCGSWTWYAVEYDPIERIFYGLVRGFETELGTFSRDELEAYRNKQFGIGIERDRHFGKHTLAEVMDRSL